MDDHDRTASLMTPSKLAQVKPRGVVNPELWLNRMAADAGQEHAKRLEEAGQALQAQALRHDFSPLTAELTRVGEALSQLDFGLLQTRGWWARTTGKSRSAGTEFAGQFAHIEEVIAEVAAQMRALQTKQQEQAGASERALLELEVEFRAIDKIIDQGTRWLQDMRTQLAMRKMGVLDEPGARQIRGDAARCDILVARLKALRALSSASQQAHQQAQATALRRAALVQLLRQVVASDVKAWQASISALALAARDSASPALNLEGPMEIHRELQLCVKQAKADCIQLLGQEKTLADSLGALAQQLQAAQS